MVIAAFDVHYLGDDRASAAAVLLSDYGDAEPAAVYTQFFPGAASYVSGEFYRRELPVILALLEEMDKALDEIVVDGYVKIGDRPGLGQHLFDSLGGKIAVIGVAKSEFKGASGIVVFRGSSARPLYVTSAGLEQEKAGERIKRMHGDYRIPAMLKLADRLARGNARSHGFISTVRGRLSGKEIIHG